MSVFKDHAGGWLAPYGPWYALAAYSALVAASAAAYGNYPGAAGAGAVAAVVAVLAARSQARWSRSGEKPLRAEMIRLIDERAGSGAVAWLNRDAHLLFDVSRRRKAGVRQRTLLVIDEEQQRHVDDMRDSGGGKVAVTGVAYFAHPVLPRVRRHAFGTTALVTASDIEDAGTAGRETWRRELTGIVRTLRAGLAFADAGELAGVVAQFRDSEPIGREELS